MNRISTTAASRATLTNALQERSTELLNRRIHFRAVTIYVKQPNAAVIQITVAGSLQTKPVQECEQLLRPGESTTAVKDPCLRSTSFRLYVIDITDTNWLGAHRICSTHHNRA